MVVAYYKLNDFEKAKNALKSNALKDADPGMHLIINAKYHASKGNYDKAILLLDKAQKSSRYLEADLTKAQILILNSKPDEAIDLLNALDVALSHSNLSDTLKLTKALALLTDDKVKRSMDLLENVEHPEKINNLHMLKAITYFSMNEKKKAIEELKQTILPYSELAVRPDFERNLNPPSIGPDIGLAFFCLDQKFYDQALIIAKKAAEKSQSNILLNFITAECYLQTEQFSPAIKELLKLNETFKGSYALQFYLSQAYAKAGMINEAAKTYKSLTKERPDFIMADLVYGELLSRFSKWEEAGKVYENGLNFMPDSAQLQISLGWVLAYLNKLDSLDNLLQIIEKNDKVKPVSLLHLKGWAAFKNKDFSKAEELLTKAIETAPGDPEICFHLGMTMMKSGKKDRAKNLLQQSLLFKKQRDRYQDTINKTLLHNK
jgi:tetratricopeptide (TPR) repeat protein